jgi:stearoyl-CoA 9-desaturase NADPH oxidoreductase
MLPKLTSRSNLRLLDALVGPHGIDGYLEQIDPLLAIAECRARVVGVERTAKGSVTLKLRPNRSWHGFRAGQFVQVAVEIDGVRHQRCYSPASAEGRGPELEITVRCHPGGLVSNFLAENAVPGMVLGLSQAEGDFQLPEPRPGSALLIGGGSGITPLMAIVRTLLAERYEGPIALLHYSRDSASAIYREELERLAEEHPNFHLARSYTRSPGAGEIDGHFSPTHLPQSEPRFADAEIFACGPSGLLDAVRGNWKNGLEHRLHVESFVPPTLVPMGKSGDGVIRFAASGREVQNTGASLLEQAEEAGVQAQFGCRMGICHTCTRRKLAGTHQNLITGETSSTPREEIQLCVSAALGDLTVDL